MDLGSMNFLCVVSFLQKTKLVIFYQILRCLMINVNSWAIPVPPTSWSVRRGTFHSPTQTLFLQASKYHFCSLILCDIENHVSFVRYMKAW